MPVSFLDLVPALPTTIVVVSTSTGPVEIQLSGVSLRALADIAKRFPSFRRVLEGDTGSIMDDPEALAALIAAALGHPGEDEYEQHIATFPSGDIMRMGIAIVRITFAQADDAPLPAAGAVAGDGLDQTSPLQLNS